MIPQLVISGLMMGAVYAVLAIGFTLMFGVLNMLNFAYPELFMFAGIIGIFLISELSISNPAIVILLTILLTGVIGIITEVICFRFVKRDPDVAPLLASIGLGLVLLNLGTNYTGGEPIPLPVRIPIENIEVGGVLISFTQSLVLMTAVIMMVLLTIIVQRTSLGRGMRALAENFCAAKLMGINVGRITLITFFIAGVLAGTVGILVTFRFCRVDPFVGMSFGLKAFALMVIGGMGSLRGAAIMGLVAGVLEILVATYGSTAYADGVIWALLILVLLFRPQGMFGMPRATRV